MKIERNILAVSILIISTSVLLIAQLSRANTISSEKKNQHIRPKAPNNILMPPRNLQKMPTSLATGPNKHSGPSLQSKLKGAAEALLPNVQVNMDPGNLIDDFAPVVAVGDNGFIYVVWNANDSMESILFSLSGNGGASFSNAVRINDDVNYPPSNKVYQPDIALDSDGNIYIVWHDYRAWADDNSWNSPIDIYLDKSTDGGLTWGTDVKVSDGSGTYPWHFQPYIAIDRNNGYIYVTFTDYDRYHPEGDYGDISVARSVDGGASFEEKIRVDDTSDIERIVQTFSSIAVDDFSGNVYVTFNDSRNSSIDIFLAKSVDSCQSFEANVLVNSDTVNAQEESTVRTDQFGQVYVVWKDWRDDPDPQSSPYLNDIYLTKSTDGGATFSPGVRITDQYMDAEYSYNFPPRLAINESGTINVVWHDTRTGISNCYFDQSTDGGITFSTDMMIHSDSDSVTHALPRVTVDAGDGVYVTWMDKRNGNNMFDIFFTRNEHTTDIGDDNIIPVGASLEQNYPNPFNPTTIIQYSLKERSHVQMRIYDSSGKLIRTLVNEHKPTGTYEARWDGRNDWGAVVTSGVYFCQMRAGEKILQRKIVSLR